MCIRDRTNWKGKGMDTRVSLKQALKSLGFQGGNKHYEKCHRISHRVCLKRHPVSYTHLDVYKRQSLESKNWSGRYLLLCGEFHFPGAKSVGRFCNIIVNIAEGVLHKVAEKQGADLPLYFFTVDGNFCFHQIISPSRLV